MGTLKHIYLVRHGSSTANELEIREGAKSELTEKGEQQAAVVAERFKQIPIEVVLSSTYIRAQKTGKKIADISNVPLETMEGIQERELPDEVIGKHRSDPAVQQAVAKFEYSWIHDTHLDEGEHFRDILKRAEKVSTELSQRKEEHIAVATHGFFMVFFTAYHLLGDYFTPDLFINSFMYSLHINNTGITHFVIKEDGSWVLVSWNDSAHLGPLKTE